MLVIAGPAQAYNDQQHQGMVAVAYKAMVAAALEDGCASPIDFQGGMPSVSIKALPDASVCGANTAGCQADWDEFLRQSERSMRFLRGIDAGLPQDSQCPGLLPTAGNLGQVPVAVGTEYHREGGCDLIQKRIAPTGEKPRFCSMPAELCSGNSIYEFLAPDDHTGDLLGYWATEADHDPSTVALGFKPVNPLIGKALDGIDEVVEDSVGAALAPFVCAVDFLFGDGDECVKHARSLADAVVPIDEINGAIPVLFPRHDFDFLGLWHFIDIADHDSPCDDVRGMLYERAGPRQVPDALDILIMVGTDLGMQYLSYDESAGTRMFNITNPDDGDQPSCNRDRTDWEATSLGHTVLAPIDNLGLFGWKEFAQSGTRKARSLGWPMHALGDAVAPHHVLGTTGWGHRPYEDSAEWNWPRVLYQDVTPVSALRVAQYDQLRRILVQAFAYWRRLAELRATRPAAATFNAIPIRAFVTEVARETYADATTPDGLPRWPLDPTLSVPYWVDQVGSRTYSIEQYTDADDVVRTRALLERGSAATVAFLTAVGQLGAPYAPAPVCGSPGATFGECGAASACATGCCVADVDPAVVCVEPCDHSGCTGTYCPSTCSDGKTCDASGCCVASACPDSACETRSDCGGSDFRCTSGCCDYIVR
jgi:hypothetical protein